MNVHLGGKKKDTWTSLVVQWLRIHLPMKGTQVQSLVQEDSTGYGATKPMCHNCWSWGYLEPMLHNKKSPPQHN